MNHKFEPWCEESESGDGQNNQEGNEFSENQPYFNSEVRRLCRIKGFDDRNPNNSTNVLEHHYGQDKLPVGFAHFAAPNDGSQHNNSRAQCNAQAEEKDGGKPFLVKDANSQRHRNSHGYANLAEALDARHLPRLEEPRNVDFHSSTEEHKHDSELVKDMRQ